MKGRKLGVQIIFLLFWPAVFAGAAGSREPFQPTVSHVDIGRFLGDWYVIALLPSPPEKRAVNGVENYSLDDQGLIRVRYTFSKDSPDGKPRVMYQKGWIINRETNAEWRVRPLWPLKLPYYILELDPDYQYTVIGTNNFRYLWIMARSPELPEETLTGILDRMDERGYPREKIRMMVQEWPHG